MPDTDIYDQAMNNEETLKRNYAILKSTFIIGITVGIIGIAGYSFSVKSAGKIVFLLSLIGAASFVSGFFLGFLFGIPKRNINKESDYNLSTNLVDISDWLTKIIIGLGLIEIKRLPGYLQSVGIYIQQQTNGENSIKIFSVCCIIYFIIFGLYYGYNYMRLFLSGQFRGADNILLNNEKKLIKYDQQLGKSTLIPNKENEDDKKTLNKYNQLLKQTKTEDNYTFNDWFYKGIDEFNKNDYYKTLAYLDNALNKDLKNPLAPDAYLYMAVAYERLDSFEKGIEIYNLILSKYPYYESLYIVYSNKAILLHKQKKYEEALTNADNAIKINPAFDISHTIRGMILAKLDKNKDAEDSFAQAMTLNPKSEELWYNRACYYAMTDQKDKMLTDLKTAMFLKPGYRESAKTDEDFKKYINDEDFKKLVD